MKSLSLVPFFAFASALGAAACFPGPDDGREVPDIAGSYTCTLQAHNGESWCPAKVQSTHLVTPTKLSIVQSLPGSGIKVHWPDVTIGGYVALDGTLYARASNLSCVTCNASNKFSLELDAKASDGALSEISLAERRHGEGSEDDCMEIYTGTCTRQ